MNRRENSGRATVSLHGGQRLNFISTVALVVLMILFLIMTAVSSMKLAEQTDIISNHPFEVVISAGDIKLYISEMSIRTERLLRHHTEEDQKLVKDALDTLHRSLETPLEQVRELYLGDEQDVTELADTVARLRAAQSGFLDYTASPSSTSEGIEEFEQTYLQPLYSLALTQAESIIGVAQRKKVGYGKTANTLRRVSLVGSVVLMALMLGVLLISQYLLRRQRKELVYRSRLFDDLSLSIDDTFLIRDAETGKISYTALNMERVLGATVRNGKIGYQGLRKEDAAEITKAIREKSFVSPYEKVVEYTKPDGDKRWMLVRVYRTESTKTPNLITVFSDRTEEIQSRQALQDAMVSAERANMAKSDFLSRMSHEIRTPLNAIIGMTSIAAAFVREPARVEDCLSKINFSSKHLLLLINDVLDMSKIESNKMALQNEPFDIFEVVNGFVSTVYAQAKGKQIDFDETMEGFGDQTVFVGDALRLNQILLNLSSNAVKFTPPGGSIRLTVSRIASKSVVDVIRFTMTDTGIGIAKDAVERIFRPFEQADASIAGRFGGTGLGMSITKNLVGLMGGKIRIESEPGKGTSCIVDLPLRRSEADAAKEPDFANEGLSALIVDDEQPVCEQTASLLQKIKIQAEWKLSGAEAVERVKQTHLVDQDFDLCLIDWKMPDMDGIEVTRQIRRAVGEEIPIVLISAYDIAEVEQQAREAGVNGFLPKPLYRSSVYAAIKEALAGRQVLSLPHEDMHRPLAGRRLLVAEDNALNREIAQQLLEMNGAEVRCAVDGQEALSLFLESPPGAYDAILMDVQMPVMDGYEATRRIRVSSHPEAKTIPIIATTANAFSDDISAALAAGMDVHVSKPLDIQQLCRVLNECIRKNNK